MSRLAMIAALLSSVASILPVVSGAEIVRLPPVAPRYHPASAQPRTLDPTERTLIDDFRQPAEFVEAGGAYDQALVPRYRWLDSLSVFLGLDGSKQPQDFGINAQFGGRAAVNWGMPIVEEWGLGAQVGTAIDATGDAVQVMDRIEGNSGRTQSFTTVGVFQRTDLGLQWGVAYDFLHEDYYDRFSLGQWRLNVGYQFTPRSTIGVWSAISAKSDAGTFGGTPITLVPITQSNLYYKYLWRNAVQTTFWGGLANQHGQVNAVLGDLPVVRTPFVFGAELHIPLTDRLALFGQGNFITPAGSGTVDSYLGFVYYPRGGARRAVQSPFAPLQTVAAPTNFAVDLRR